MSEFESASADQEKSIAVITGAASGIGLAIADRLLRDGARVVVTDLQRPLGERVARERGFEFLEHDVTCEEQWVFVLEEIRRRHGRLDILVNNAGILGDSSASGPEDTTLEMWRQTFAVNVEGVFLGCKRALSLLKHSSHASIINLSSVAGLLATPHATAYGASKAAVRQLTKSVAQYCVEKRFPIRCNSVHPGNVRTPLWDRQAAESARRRGVPVEEIISEGQEAIPMGDFTRPEDVASAVAFLASQEARHITGSELIVDGGFVHCDTFHVRRNIVREA